MYTKKIYVKYQPEGAHEKWNKAIHIFTRLAKPIECRNKNLTTNIWYTSLPLAKELLDKTIPTIVAIRKQMGNPSRFCKQSEGKSLFDFQENTVLVSYVSMKTKLVLHKLYITVMNPQMTRKNRYDFRV